MARSNLNLGMTSLRWALRQPSKVAVVSQIEAPLDGERGGTRQETGEGRVEENVETTLLYSKREPNKGGLGTTEILTLTKLHAYAIKNSTATIQYLQHFYAEASARKSTHGSARLAPLGKRGLWNVLSNMTICQLQAECSDETCCTHKAPLHGCRCLKSKQPEKTQRTSAQDSCQRKSG